ncbi:MAG TPA: hypothetical protein VGD49_01365 [Longimicrobiales bacterium]
MRFKTLVLTSAFAVATPIAANAATCVDIYQQCLNDTWNTSGLTRILADIECGAKYAGCVRRAIV